MASTISIDTNTSDYKSLLDLLSIVTDASNQLGTLEIRANQELMEFVDEVRDDYAVLQTALTKADAAIRALVGSHPEWFGNKKSIATPYGVVKSKKVTKLEVPNEEATVLLIQHNDELADTEYLRQSIAPNLEALEKLTDKQLKALRITRITDESISITPAKQDLGKAVAAPLEEKKAA